MKTSANRSVAPRRGFTLMELLVGKVVVGVAALLAVASVKGMERKNLALGVQKIRSVGDALVAYTADHGGVLPLDDALGKDDWTNAAKPESAEVWYNALPKLMKAKTVGEIGKTDPKEFYQDAYVLFLPGAPYPDVEKRVLKPYFAFGMNSRLHRRNDDGERARVRLASVQAPVQTVLLLERGLPGDRKHSKLQRGFDGRPKASPHAFVTRYGGKGILLFADGHVELRAFEDLVEANGRIHFPQKVLVWTCDPAVDPN